MCLYTVRQKVRHQVFLIISSNNDRFAKFFQLRTLHKLAVKKSLNIPPPLKRVAAVPCEIFMAENWLK